MERLFPSGPAIARHGPAEAGPYLQGALLGALLAASVACGGKSAEEEKPPEVPTIVADTTKVTRRTVVDELVVRGTVAAVPNEDVKVSALVPGRSTSRRTPKVSLFSTWLLVAGVGVSGCSV